MKREFRVRKTSVFRWFLVALLLLLLSPLGAFAANGFGPKTYKSDYTYGQGVFFAPYHTEIYAAPQQDAPLVEDITWQQGDGSGYKVYSNLHNRILTANQPFFCHYPALDIAMMAVITDNDDGWVEVIYDQSTKKTGWVKLWKDTPANPEQLAPMDRVDAPPYFGKFLSWIDFMKFNAKPNGFYWLNGVSSYHRSVRMMDKDEAPLLDMMAIRDIKVRHVRGNWLLVEVLDFTRESPIGWVRWRDNDGNLLLFPNFSGERQGIQVTGSFR